LKVIIVFGEVYNLWSSPYYSHIHPHYFVIGPRVLRGTLFSNALNLRSTFSLGDQVSHPYNETRKIIDYLYFNLYIRNGKMDSEDSELNDSIGSPNVICS